MTPLLGLLLLALSLSPGSRAGLGVAAHSVSPAPLAGSHALARVGEIQLEPLFRTGRPVASSSSAPLSPVESARAAAAQRRARGQRPFQAPELDSAASKHLRVATASEQEDAYVPAWDDRFALSFTLHRAVHCDGDDLLDFVQREQEEERVTILLRPSRDLVHPSGIKFKVTHRSHADADVDGATSSEERTVHRSHVRAYEGIVLPSEMGERERKRWFDEERVGVVRSTDQLAEVGWARVTLAEVPDAEGKKVSFRGAYTAPDGSHFTIMPSAQYTRTRSPLDPPSPSSRDMDLLVISDDDVLSPDQHMSDLARTLKKRALDGESPQGAREMGCGHDELAFNVDPAHPVWETAFEDALAAMDRQRDEDELRQATSPWVGALFGRELTNGARSYPPRSRTTLGRRQSTGGGDISGGSDASSNFINSIGSTSGCPNSQTVVFVGVAADCTYSAQFASADDVRTQILTDFNSVSQLYQSTFNVSLGIIELDVQTGACPTTTAEVDQSVPWNVGCEEGGGPGVNLNERLSIFSEWRGNKGADGAGLWHLLTNCSTQNEVGVAWLGQLCKITATESNGQMASGTGVTAITRSEWQVIAHEIGHNFGAIHDCVSGCSSSGSCCPLSTSSCDSNYDYIMSPVSRKNVSSFSPCSVGNICTTLSSSLNTTCLAAPGQADNPSVISLQACGNGIVEDGEDCDPGSKDDPCCDASTCKFASGAVCSPLNSLCCSDSCQIASAGTVCRAAVDARCDIAETCPGDSADCPPDEAQPDGQSCGDGSLACASGVCTSRDLQCQTAGDSLGITQACPASASSSCSITCQNPSSSASCIVLDQSFRDGTPCGYAGRCENSECIAGSALDTAKSWYRNNLQISIPVTIVVALLVLAVLFCIFRACRRRCGGGARDKHQPSRRGPPGVAAAGARRSRLGGRRLARGGDSSAGGPMPPPPVHHGSHPGQADSNSSLASNRPLMQQQYHPAPPGTQEQQPQWGGPQYAAPPFPPPSHPSSPPRSRRDNWVDPSAWNGPNHRP